MSTRLPATSPWRSMTKLRPRPLPPRRAPLAPPPQLAPPAQCHRRQPRNLAEDPGAAAVHSRSPRRPSRSPRSESRIGIVDLRHCVDRGLRPDPPQRAPPGHRRRPAPDPVADRGAIAVPRGLAIDARVGCAVGFGCPVGLGGPIGIGWSIELGGTLAIGRAECFAVCVLIGNHLGSPAKVATTPR